MKIRTFLFTLWQGVRNLFRNGWYSLASIATIGACLFLLGMFYAIIMNVQNVMHKVEEGVSLTVFFYPDATDQRVEEIGQQILNRAEVRDVIYHSDEDVWAEFGPRYLGEENMQYFDENPMAGEHNYDVYLDDVSMQDTLVKWLEDIPEIRLVRYSEVTASTLSGVNLLIAYVSAGIIVILLLVSVFLISNTVRVGISVRAEEISIMKYIGAKDFFVRAPFVLECMLIGLVGAALPLIIIYRLYDYVLNYVTERFSMLGTVLSFLPLGDIFRILAPVSLLIGVGIGFLGSITTVRKHLHV